jgi:hypothetical protein
MNLNKYQNCLNFLFKHNCDKILHSKSNFLNHLINTFNLLKKWKQHEDLCFAGMFNNIYNNKYLDSNINITRDEIKKLIGENAEELVFTFTNFDKKKINESGNKVLIILIAAKDYTENQIFMIEDNLYDQNTSQVIENYFFNVPWKFDGYGSTDVSRKWNYYLNFKEDIEKNFLRLNDNLLKKYNLKDLFTLNRAYASANSFGYAGEYHVDDGAKEFNDIVTIMYYLNSMWDVKFDGETSFLNNERNEIIHSVIPKPARSVIFDGFIFHGPKPLSKIYGGLRMVLTFKYKIHGS